MFGVAGGHGVTAQAAATPTAVGEPGIDAASVASWCAALARMNRDVSDAERIDQIRALEELKAAAAAAQARAAVDLDTSQRRAQAAAGVPAKRRGQGVAAQVALARRDSPSRGGRHLGFAKAVVLEMPHTHAALTSGRLSEWRATLLVRETACLDVEDRTTLDTQLAADADRLEHLSDRQLVAEAKRIAYRLDAASVVRRARKAESERTVTIRPAPDTMTYVTALLPVAEGVAVHAALIRAADALRVQGDGRSRGQAMADTLVERVTGRSVPADTRLELQLVMTDRALLSGEDEPAHVPGYGTVPAAWARDLVRSCLENPAQVWLRRLYTAPTTGQLVAMDSRARCAPETLARFIDARDQWCRTPWCGAPIRHRDHVVPHEAGGATSAGNLQGLCEACNYAKQALGWDAEPGAPPGGGHGVVTTTPTGHRYRSLAPPVGGRPPPHEKEFAVSLVERRVIDYLYAA